MVSFSYIPVSSIRIPGTYVELNNANANTFQTNQIAIAVGQMTSSGTATPNVPIPVSGNYNQLFGYGSMLSIMCARFLANNTATQLYALPLSDNGSATKTVQTITITGPATAAGTLSIYVAGNLTQTAVNSGDTATIIATNVAASINAISTLPVTATSSAGVVTVTCNNAGLAAGDCPIVLNYAGGMSNQVTPSGVGVTIAVATQGATNPILTTAFANIAANLNVDFMIFPYTDSTSVSALESFMSQSSGRWSWEQQAYGFAWSAYRGSMSALTTYGITNNTQFLSVFGIYYEPMAVYDVAAAIVAAVTPTVQNSPALPIQNISCAVMAPPSQYQFTPVERNTLLYDGISTLKWNIAGNGEIERAITTYQLNSEGSPDTSYLSVETIYTSMYVERYYINQLSSIYAQYSLVPNGTQIQAGDNVTTPNGILGTCLTIYNDLADLNLVVNPSQFAAAATATAVGNGIVELYLPVQYAGQLRVIAAQLAFSTPL